MAAALALLSGLLWGTADFGGGLVTRRLPSLVVVGWSQAAAFVALAIGAVVTRTGPPAGPWLVWGLLTGVAGAGGLVCFYRALSTQAGLSASSVHQVHSVIRRALAQDVADPRGERIAPRDASPQERLLAYTGRGG